MSTPARWLVGVLVVALLLVTVLLSFLALQRSKTTPDDAPAPVPSFSLGGPRTTTPTPASSPSASPAPSTSATGSPRGADATERFLTVGSAVVWRASAGACGATAPVIERSTDAGATWNDVTPSYRQIARVLSLDAFAGTQAEAVAAVGTGCEVQALRTFTQGEFWAPYPEVLRASRYLDPARASTVVTPQGAVTTPCDEPRSFRAQGEVVALVCDGTAQRLANGTWTPLPAPDVVALGVADGTLLTASVSGGCDGVAVTRWSGAGFAVAEELGCAVGADPAAPLAVTGTLSGALVWSGEELLSPTP